MSLFPHLIFSPGVFTFKKYPSKTVSIVNKNKFYEAREEERQRICADMHDELGSGITAISFMSELVKSKLNDPIPQELEKISATARELLGTMHAIIWSMNSKQDSVYSLVSYIQSWALEYFDYTGISCKVSIPPNISHFNIDGEKRRNIYLSVKEALTNILKHAFATQVQIIISYQPVFKIHISDNGRGIDFTNLRPFGNGIRNMQKRMDAINGKLEIQNQNGTTILFEIPFA